MASYNEESILISFLLVSVLQLANSQIICRIEVDSTLGLWQDVTPTPAPPNQPPNCIGYSYRETSPTCTSPQCQSSGSVDGTCTLYSNVGTRQPCLATCKKGCTHEKKCPSGKDLCPCQKQVPRYEARMCVPYQNLQNCLDKQVNEKNECVPKSCIDACQNGRCAKKGTCICLSGFSLEPSSKECVPAECHSACVNGICNVYGVCTCNEGFNKNAEYKCDRIDCPDVRNTEFCQSECINFGCNQNNGQCVQGKCKCDAGFKMSANKYKCEPIRCPDPDETSYCKAECGKRCTNGQCNDQGDCDCYHGYKINSYDEYVCHQIICPATVEEDDQYCKKQCIGLCTKGTCDKIGFCKCNTGFKKASSNTYQCNEINCPPTESDDNEYCKTQCGNFCDNGVCDDSGHCQCHEGFTKLDNELYKCGPINCLSSTVKSDTELAFCKSVCGQKCTSGECDASGFCLCSKGFKKIPGENYKCAKIKCPTSKPEDQAYCKGRCSKTCTNGDCDVRGACVCHEDFKSTNRSRVDCHHECHDDDSCSLEAILAGIFGGGFAVVVAIIVVTVLVIREKNREERAKREKVCPEVALPAMPLETLVEEPEYVNYGQEAEAEENDMYHSFEQRQAGRDRVQ